MILTDSSVRSDDHQDIHLSLVLSLRSGARERHKLGKDMLARLLDVVQHDWLLTVLEVWAEQMKRDEDGQRFWSPSVALETGGTLLG